MREPNFSKFMNARIIDGHLHFEDISLIRQTSGFFRTLNIEKLGIVSYARLKEVNSNPQAICFKAMYPRDTYIMGGLDYTDIDKYSKQEIEKALAEQVLTMTKIGFDGIKLLETKPSVARDMPFSIDDPVYNSFFALLEERQLPIFWHVADPEEFWNEQMIPPDAKTMGWSYSDGTYPSKEKLYERVERVLSRFPNLQVVFAHFYFLSANLKRASAIMDTYSNVNFDITPGSEMYYNFSREPEETRRFFINYQDRIVFGDDTAIRKREDIPKERTITKIFVMRNFLETDERFDKSFSIIQRKAEIQGIKLPVSVLNKIYQDNYLRIVGEDPCPLNITLAGKYCHRVGQILRIKFGFPNEMNFGYEAEDFLSSIKGRPK